MRPSWHKLANCGPTGELGPDATVRVNTMFPHSKSELAAALLVCSSCPVADRCKASFQQPSLYHARTQRWCAECGVGFTSRDRSLVCSKPCRALRSAKQDRLRHADHRMKVAAAKACDICDEYPEHHVACPAADMERRRREQAA